MKTCVLKSSLFLILLLVCLQVEASPWTSPPDTLVSTGASDTTVATNATGVSVAAWVDADVRISVSVRPTGVNSSWGTASQISTNGKTVTTPVVSINDNGDAIAIWKNSTDTTIEASFRPVGTGVWSSSAVISSTADTAVDLQKKVAMNNLIAVCVWRHDHGADERIETNTFNIGTGLWGTAEFISGDGADSPDVAVGSDSTTAVIWRIQRTKLEIEANIRKLGDSWSSASILQLSGATQDAANPAIGINSSGSPVAIWSYQSDGTNHVVQAACWTGTAWSSAVNLSGTLASVATLSLAVNGNGNAAASWLATTAAQPLALVYASFLNNLAACSWTAETLVSNSAIMAAVGPQAGIDALGNAIIVWNELIAIEADAIQSRFFLHSGTSWNASEIVTIYNGVLMGDIGLGVGSGGSAAAVWVDQFLSNKGLAAYFTVSYPPLNVTAERKSDRFLGQKDLYNKLRGNNHPNISPSSYSVYRADGTTLVKTVGTTNMLKFEEHNRRRNIFETYQVVTNNSNGGESFPFAYTVTK